MEVLEERRVHIFLALRHERHYDRVLPNFGSPKIAFRGVTRKNVTFGPDITLNPQTLLELPVVTGGRAADNVYALTVRQDGERRPTLNEDIRIQLPAADQKVETARGIRRHIAGLCQTANPTRGEAEAVTHVKIGVGVIKLRLQRIRKATSRWTGTASAEAPGELSSRV